ncbi:MAG: BrnA antitoxin family protein [Treponema sp.]|nr:BrnA antitoxin family protein [Treponema sp.]
MGITSSTVRVGQKPTKEQLKQIREIAKRPIHYTKDCPESTPEALAEFAAMARARRKRKTKPMVSLRLEPEALEKYKSLGEGYTGIMADVLNYVANTPEILSRASRVAVIK